VERNQEHGGGNGDASINELSAQTRNWTHCHQEVLTRTVLKQNCGEREKSLSNPLSPCGWEPESEKKVESLVAGKKSPKKRLPSGGREVGS